MSRIKKGGLIGALVGAVGALSVATVGGFEGLRTRAYQDQVGVWTLCYGETRGIRKGMTRTKAQCDAMLLKALDEFATSMERCVPSTKTMPAQRYVAHLSLSYNIGQAAYCRSTVARRTNAGNIRGGCDAFLMWDKAGGRRLPGLTRRRQEERAMCLRGL
ncbi:lysozyme [Enterovirga rhinocerotis]|uniref:Lysozyme n=1 Tax=Enterovirga rhinocerotis TaxID=1339210 RepID=A0A4R7CA28_9HYPH|nr:lysozyme [Enterovirga rhinocerotis]TDR94215.1 lysozyme [Enterovirga rhinocerotis]